MTTSPYGQPEPFDPGVVAGAGRTSRPTPRSDGSSRSWAAVVLAVVAFAGGFAVANATVDPERGRDRRER